MIDILKSLFKSSNSKNVAKDRLKLVLIHDRANVSPHLLEMLKGEIIEVIKKYIDISDEELDISLTKTQGENKDTFVPALIANIPIKNMKKDLK